MFFSSTFSRLKQRSEDVRAEISREKEEVAGNFRRTLIEKEFPKAMAEDHQINYQGDEFTVSITLPPLYCPDCRHKPDIDQVIARTIEMMEEYDKAQCRSEMIDSQNRTITCQFKK